MYIYIYIHCMYIYIYIIKHSFIIKMKHIHICITNISKVMVFIGTVFFLVTSRVKSLSKLDFCSYISEIVHKKSKPTKHNILGRFAFL